MIGAISVLIGGGIGACLRYLFSSLAKKHFGITHWATFVINIVGCLFLGYIAAFAIKHPNFIEHNFYLLLTTGIAGGFTTFSTFCYENLELLQQGKILHSLIYFKLSLLIGVLAVSLGYALVHII